MKKYLTKLAALVLAAGALAGALGTTAFANFGAGAAAVVNAEGTLIKTGIFGKKLSFCDTDFKQGLAVSDFDSITVTRLPSSTEGVLMLGGRRVTAGAKIRRKNIGALVFIPTSAEVAKSSFSFTLSPYADGRELTYVLKFTDKINYEPEIDAASSASLTTQRDIAIFGKMEATDKENDEISYIVVSYPEHGTLTLDEAGGGSFRYTPLAGYVGEDEFRYVARDEWGNYSRLATMTVTVGERLSEVVYTDMKDSPEYNAAVTLSAMGIMSGRIIGDGTYFMPNEEVTRAEFVSMLMKTLGIRADSTVTSTYFDDNDEIPTALIGYVGTAQRAGFITGSFEGGRLLFKPNESISVYEAAATMARVLGDELKSEAADATLSGDIPVWARDDVWALSAAGVLGAEYDDIRRDDVVTRRDCAAYFYKLLQM